MNPLKRKAEEVPEVPSPESKKAKTEFGVNATPSPDCSPKSKGKKRVFDGIFGTGFKPQTEKFIWHGVSSPHKNGPAPRY